MSQENVELVRQAWDAYRNGGFEAVRRLLHPDFEMMRSGLDFPESGIYRGYEAAMKTMQDYMEAFEYHRTEPEEFIDAGDQVVVAQGERGRARSSSVELRETWYAVCTLSDGKILRLQWFGARSEALKAVGLAD